MTYAWAYLDVDDAVADERLEEDAHETDEAVLHVAILHVLTS